MSNKAPIRVAVTGAAGQIGYSLLFPIAAGHVFGPDQPVIPSFLSWPQCSRRRQNGASGRLI